MKKVKKHELFGSPVQRSTSFAKWYMTSRNIYDVIQKKTGHTNRNHCRLRDGGAIPYKYWIPSPVEPLSHRPSRGYYFKVGTHVLKMPKAIETITAYDIKEMAAMNTLDVDVTVDVFLYHFRMYKTLFRSHLDDFKKRLLTTVTIPANEIVSLLSDFKLDNLDTDAFTIEIVPRELQFTHPKRFFGGGNVTGIHVTTSFTKSLTVHTKKTVRELYDLGHLGQGTDDTQPQPTEIVDTSGETEKSALTNTSSANVSAFVSGSSQKPDNIKVDFKETELIVKVADQMLPLGQVNRQIFDTKEGFFRQITSIHNAEIVGKNDLGLSLNTFFIVTNEGFEQQINQLTSRDLDANVNYTVRPTRRVGDSRPAPPPYVIEGDKKSNFISIWTIDDLVIIEDRRKDLVPDAKIRATLIKDYKYKTRENGLSVSSSLELDSVELSITFVCVGVLAIQLDNTRGGYTSHNGGALYGQDGGHFEYEVIVETFDKDGNSLGDRTITLDSSVDRVPKITNSFAFDSYNSGEDDFWVKNRTFTKAITLYKSGNEAVQNIAIKSSQAKLKTSTNWHPTEIAPRKDVFKLDGRDLADKPLTSITNFTVTVIDGETSGKKTFRLSWVDSDEPSDDVIYDIGIRGSSIVATDTTGTVEKIHSSAHFVVDKNATSFDIPEDKIFFDDTLLTSDMLDESRFEFKFRKILEIDTGRYLPNTTSFALSVVIYEGSQYISGHFTDNFITGNSDIYYQTEGLYYGVSYSPNLFYIAKDRGGNPYSFSGNGTQNINLCDYYIVIKGRPQSDLSVSLYNGPTGHSFLGTSTKLHSSGLFWNGESFSGFSDHGIRQNARWTVIRVPLLKHWGVNRIRILSTIGDYDIDIRDLFISEHPDYPDGHETNVVGNNDRGYRGLGRAGISVSTNWQNNSNKLNDYDRRTIGTLNNVNKRGWDVTTFADDERQVMMPSLSKTSFFPSPRVSNPLGILNKKLVQTPSTLDFQGDIIFEDENPHSLRPTVRILFSNEDYNPTLEESSTNFKDHIYNRNIHSPFAFDSTTDMFYNRYEVSLNTIVKSGFRSSTKIPYTESEAQNAIGDAKFIIESFIPKLTYGSFSGNSIYPPKIRLSIIGIDLQGLVGDTSKEVIGSRVAKFSSTPLELAQSRSYILNAILHDMRIGVFSSSPDHVYIEPEYAEYWRVHYILFPPIYPHLQLPR
tara:strand:+ start:1490 stop:5059 length:3570 start_codon:yes stop_codon:yes gene_type:complete